MSEEKWLTVSELALTFEIPQPTIRRYIDRHGHHLRTQKQHKSYLISELSIPVIVRIREGYAKGMNSDQVEALLVSAGIPMIVEVDSTQGNERVSGFDAVAIVESLQRQEEFNRRLLESLERERLENQRQRGEDRVKIDQLMVLLSQQQQMAATLSDPVHLRHERLNERITEIRIEKQLRVEALEAWKAKPEADRIRRIGLFRKEEDAVARDQFVRSYIDEHIEQRLKAAYILDDRS